MKTTFDIPEGLLRDVQALARRRGTTSKSLVEQALRRLLDDSSTTFVLRDATVTGDGLTVEFADKPWEHMRDTIYQP